MTIDEFTSRDDRCEIYVAYGGALCPSAVERAAAMTPIGYIGDLTASTAA